MSSATHCEFKGCRAEGEHIVHSEAWGKPTDRRACDRHVRIARLNDAYEVVTDE